MLFNDDFFKRLNEGLDSSYPENVRAAAHILVVLDRDGYMTPMDEGVVMLRKASKALYETLASGWMDEWNDSSEVRGHIEKELKDIQDILSDPKRWWNRKENKDDVEKVDSEMESCDK
ncbi:MAG TPA: hypothetical protein EYQ21_07170 [Flavobacteriales bacterium]|nr:hypothetical protein [Flavobacteriales bacterium]